MQKKNRTERTEHGTETHIYIGRAYCMVISVARSVWLLVAVSRVAKRQSRRMGAVLIFNCVDAAVCVVAALIAVAVAENVNACTRRQSVGWFGAVWSLTARCSSLSSCLLRSSSTILSVCAASSPSPSTSSEQTQIELQLGRRKRQRSAEQPHSSFSSRDSANASASGSSNANPKIYNCQQ